MPHGGVGERKPRLRTNGKDGALDARVAPMATLVMTASKEVWVGSDGEEVGFFTGNMAGNCQLRGRWKKY